MGVTIYEPPSRSPEEPRRERAVERSGALLIRNDPQLQALVAEASAVLHTSMAAVSIVYRDWQYLIAAEGMPTGPYSRRASLCGHAILATDTDEDVFCIPDAWRDPRFADNPMLAGTQLLRFYAGAPLVDDDGLTLGMLCVIDSTPRDPLRPAERRRLSELARLAVKRLEQLRPV
uniref:GAF domain-containing protein n=1 Tax=uncultured Sphingomonas sp. TaxID=158754 RepID=UPI0008369B75|nr:GAF domain-containing protein [uncultured Sphingomonas sp.]